MVPPRADAPMLRMEEEIDASGQGPFCWLNTKAIFDSVEPLLSPRRSASSGYSATDQPCNSSLLA